MKNKSAKYQFRWSLWVRLVRATDIRKQPRQLLLKAIDNGTIKKVGRGNYRIIGSGQRKRA